MSVVKYRIVKGVAKELIRMTHGHELKWGGGQEGNAGGKGGTRQRGTKERKKEWDNCNSIINKMYFKNK